MKNIFYPLLIILFMIGCEDTEDATATLVGTWNYSGVQIEGGCDGTGVEDNSGTIMFTETDFTMTQSLTLADWCDEDLVNDTLCVEYGDSTSLSEYQESCVDDGGTFNTTTGTCTSLEGGNYTISDSLYLSFVSAVDVPANFEDICVEEGGVFTLNSTDTNAVCTLTNTSGYVLDLDINTASFARTSTQNDTLYCDKVILTK